MTEIIDLTQIDTVKKLDITVDVKKLKDELNILVNQFPELRNMPQFSIMSLDGTNDWESSTGRWKDITNIKSPKEFCYVVEALRGTYLEFLVTKKFPNSYRWRLWKQKPNECLRPHSDGDWRIHIPIYTTPQCFLALLDDKLFDGEYEKETKITFYHLEENSVYILNAHNKKHGVFNFSPDVERWHLVGSIR